MITHSRIWPTGVLCLATLLAAALPAGSEDKLAGKTAGKTVKRPSLSLKAIPAIGFSPANIHLAAQLTGGPGDFEEYYCPVVEWDWGDGTKSESSFDCEPYETGKSEIQRRFSADHVYQYAGRYRIFIRLKRKDKVLVAATATVQVRPGLHELGDSK
ncbi:MAG: hypothetical protein HYX76_09435 [Acidobacteria bacterium]|nr:hypothetical protein [Acidobacteriota bacterium]